MILDQQRLPEICSGCKVSSVSAWSAADPCTSLIRIFGSGLLYEEAIANLWDNFREEYGDVEGRDLALVNIVYDAEAINLFVYTHPTVSVRADVVEFTRQRPTHKLAVSRHM